MTETDKIVAATLAAATPSTGGAPVGDLWHRYKDFLELLKKEDSEKGAYP